MNRRLPAPRQSPPPPPQIPLVGWHEAMRSIVFLNHDGTSTGHFSVDQLQRLGYFGTDAEYRKALPRLDPSPLAAIR